MQLFLNEIYNILITKYLQIIQLRHLAADGADLGRFAWEKSISPRRHRHAATRTRPPSIPLLHVARPAGLPEWDVDGVGGEAPAVAEEGVEMDCGNVGLRQGVSGSALGLQPFSGELDGQRLVAAQNGRQEASQLQVRLVDVEIQRVVGGRLTHHQTGVKIDLQHSIVVEMHLVDRHRGHRPTAQHDTWVVDEAVGGEAVFVQSPEVGIGAQFHTLGVMMEANEVGIGHARREAHYVDKRVAMRLLRLGLGVAHLLGLAAHHLFLGYGIDRVYLIPYSPPYLVTLHCCHNVWF